MNYQRLLDLTEKVLVLRGGPRLRQLGTLWAQGQARRLRSRWWPYAATPRSFDPNPDLTAAQEIVDRFGGKVIRFDETPFDPKVIY